MNEKKSSLLLQNSYPFIRLRIYIKLILRSHPTMNTWILCQHIYCPIHNRLSPSNDHHFTQTKKLCKITIVILQSFSLERLLFKTDQNLNFPFFITRVGPPIESNHLFSIVFLIKEALCPFNLNPRATPTPLLYPSEQTTPLFWKTKDYFIRW